MREQAVAAAQIQDFDVLGRSQHLAIKVILAIIPVQEDLFLVETIG
jgi:hypothetical protein